MKRFRKTIMLAMTLLLSSTTMGCSDGLVPIENMSEFITSFVNANYPGFVHKSTTDDFRGITVNIVHQATSKTIEFSVDEEWLATWWSVSIYNLPEAVSYKVRNYYYLYTIVESRFYETPDGAYYWLDLDADVAVDYNLKIAPDGTIIERTRD